eukprot:m.714785 g.714785  ORF g.714785 m.714785 type:complete len:638 (+) comp22973_c0_seq8:211-2124(+)
MATAAGIPHNVHGEKGVYCAGDWIPIEDFGAHMNRLDAFTSSLACKGCSSKAVDNFDFDVVIIGAGCVGSCIARELSKYDITVALLDSADDVSHGGATKANSGIVHTGYDDKPGTNRAKFCWAGNQMFKQMDRELNFGYHVNGSLVVARCAEDMLILDELLERGRVNGVQNLRIVHHEELRAMEPSLTPDAIAALYAQDCGTVTPYEFAIAVAENAANNGVEIRLCRHVTSIAQAANGFHIEANFTPLAASDAGFGLTEPSTWPLPLWTGLLALLLLAVAVLCGDIVSTTDPTRSILDSSIIAFGAPMGALLVLVAYRLMGNSNAVTKEMYTARAVINAAGCGSDKVASMVGIKDFHIKERMGEYLLLHKDQGQHCRHVLFPAPGPMGKGVLVQPTLWGNLLLGPTARDKHNSKAMSQSNEEIIATLLQKCRELVPAFDATKVIHSFSGSRAKNSSGDWIIEESVKVPGFFQAAGIDSPGLAGSPAIAAHVVSLVQKSAACAERGLRFKPNTNFNPYRKPIIRPKNGWKGIKIDCKDDAAKNVVCKCEKVTEAEIVDAIHRPLPCLSTQAVRKRTRAGMGHCQGKFCEPRVKKIIARELGLKSVAGRPWPASSILPARWLTDEHKEALQNLATKMGL